MDAKTHILVYKLGIFKNLNQTNLRAQVENQACKVKLGNGHNIFLMYLTKFLVSEQSAEIFNVSLNTVLINIGIKITVETWESVEF